MLSKDAIKSLRRSKILLDAMKYPKHIAVAASKDENLDVLYELIELQTKFDIPIITVNPMITKDFGEFLDGLRTNPLVQKYKIKFAVFGKWYEQPSDIRNSIKKLLEETSDYDNFFFNFCMNYDGQQEIIDACKLLIRKAKLDRINPDNIDKSVIKENLYSSYFLPPDLMLLIAEKKLLGFLMWDVQNAKIYLSSKTAEEFDEKEFLKAIRYYQQ